MAQSDKEFKDLKDKADKTDKALKDMTLEPRKIEPMIASVAESRNGKGSYLIGTHRKKI